MRGELVALDLETTGLDPAQDAIIEVGAVRMKDGEIVDEFSMLVNPDRPIPQYVTHITGIEDSHVRGAPYIASVLPAFRTFAGNTPVIGHNVGFDLGFLHRLGILQNNLKIDTYELASVLMPSAPRYTLSSLANQINIDLENAHRALDDARAAGLLYWLLWQKALALPYATLYEITTAAQGFDWDARAVFEAALRESTRPGTTENSRENGRIPDSGPRLHEAIRPKEQHSPLDTERVVGLIGNGGALSQRMAAYEERPEQAVMTRAITEAFNQSQQVMVEAGTGTGKSIAYLLPAILWATANQEQVVISTNTINLQEQLISKDIPELAAALDVPFQASVLKGRGNYLCPRRLATLRRRQPNSLDELRVLAKILVWMLENSSGDKSEISLRGPAEHHIWQRLSAEDEHCTLDRCESLMQGICPFYRARKGAESAHLLIVNHALLLADAAYESKVLPDYRYLVIDEAHHLEEAATNSLSFRLDDATLRRGLADLGGAKSGLLGDMLNSTRGAIPDKDQKRLEAFVSEISKATRAMEVHIRSLFDALSAFLRDINAGGRGSDFVPQTRMNAELRAKTSFAAVQAVWMPLQEFFEVLSSAMLQLTGALDKMQTYPIADYSDLVSSTRAAARHLTEMSAQLKAFLLEPDDNVVYWIGGGQNSGYISLQGAPLHIGPLMEKLVWQDKETIVMTSATLQSSRSFDYIRERLHGYHFETLEIGSPFNYQASTLVFVPNDVPEPNDKQGYQDAVERGIIELAAALDGRVLALFTSYSQLRQTAQAITPRLALGNITVYDQSDGSSRQTLLHGFRSTEKSVLLGTKSFWEGVDIPGGALSALVITRLPFAVPTDPIFAARSETYKDSFNQYALPDAILRFRQGFGRLIRTQQDRGVVAVFDRRIISKGYGADFLASLPECTVKQAPLRALPQTAKAWIEAKAEE